METKEMIYELRKQMQLSQSEFAEKLFVTRQAVSRWENGETLPSTDMLMQMAETFDTSVDALLGVPPRQCQSCGMVLESDDVKGSEAGGGKSEDYCSYCYYSGGQIPGEYAIIDT